MMLMGLALVATLLFPSYVSAETLQTVSLNNSDQLVYTQSSDALASAFDGMAPGDTRTVAIQVKNENSHTASFFISQATIAALETINANAKGGAYDFELSVGTSETSAVSLLNTVAGGYDAAQTASATGLSDVTELEDYHYLAELANGESTNVYLTLSLDGESFDSNYANAIGTLAYQFRAYYKDDLKPVVVTKYVTRSGGTNVIRKIVDEIVPLAGGVKTGDQAPILIVLALLAAGIVLVVVSGIKRKVESK